MELHANLEVVRSLIGVWRGEGTGHYPTITSFEFTEELTFTNIGKPFLHYQQRTWTKDGKPMHTETGYLRVPNPEQVEFILALPTGQTELGEGPLVSHDSGFTISLESRVQNSSTAKQVDMTTRSYALEGDTLRTEFGMMAVGQPLTNHLQSSLHRVKQ